MIRLDPAEIPAEAEVCVEIACTALLMAHFDGAAEVVLPVDVLRVVLATLAAAAGAASRAPVPEVVVVEVVRGER